MFVLLMMSGKSLAGGRSSACCWEPAGGSGSSWGLDRAGEMCLGVQHRRAVWRCVSRKAFLSQFPSFLGVDRGVAFSELCLVGLSSAVCFSRARTARPDTEGSN